MADRADTLPRRLTAGQQPALLRPAQVTDPEKRREILLRATSGLRLGVAVTKDMYRPL